MKADAARNFSRRTTLFLFAVSGGNTPHSRKNPPKDTSGDSDVEGHTWGTMLHRVRRSQKPSAMENMWHRQDYIYEKGLQGRKQSRVREFGSSGDTEGPGQQVAQAHQVTKSSL